MDFNTTTNVEYQWPFPKPIVGKPQLRFKDCAKRDMADLNISHKNWEKLADDRNGWRIGVGQGCRVHNDASVVGRRDCICGRWVLLQPCEPPSPDAVPTVRPAPVAPYCHCDAHSYAPRVEQYKQLLDKEQKLCQEYEQLRRQMVDVTNDILDHPCDDLDSKMETMYQATFKKRSFPTSDYRAIIAASQSTAPIPMESHRLGMLRCYKDPTHFMEKPPTVRPTINPPGTVHTGVAPKAIQTWFTEFPGRTEYMDTYSASAKACWRSMQRFKEPMPSTRRRADDTCV